MSKWSRIVARANQVTNKTSSIKIEYRPKTGGDFELDANFWSSYFEMDELGVPVQQQQPKLGVVLADFPEGTIPKQGDHVVIANDIFRISSVQMDKGYGTADLYLHL